ncbi:hypothetical protein NUW54_g11092 [Trametes sanguinea]|uniref:Uncharacterized protein n=1 Tax=Trametes sanguinea TaxID=158606 RepID=A0ACC1NLI9_9APHY|nr:hypothetical protein NUW54_g11092 [Trametes sanguinea]
MRAVNRICRYGTFLFNRLVRPPRFLRPRSDDVPAAPTEDEGETQTLLAEEALEDTAILPSELGRSGFDVVPPEEHAAHQHKHSRARTASAGPVLAADDEDVLVFELPCEQEGAAVQGRGIWRHAQAGEWVDVRALERLEAKVKSHDALQLKSVFRIGAKLWDP